MFVPEWMQQQDNALLIITLLLTLWLWLLINRRQEEENRQTIRKSPLTYEELGRTVFASCLSKDFIVYRSLFLNAKEAHDKLGVVAEEFLEQRSQAVLKTSFQNFSTFIGVGCVYRGSSEENGTLTIRIQPPDGDETKLAIGTMTVVGNIFRLLLPNQSNS